MDLLPGYIKVDIHEYSCLISASFPDMLVLISRDPFLCTKLRLLLEWILQNMVRHFVTHKQVHADKRHPI